MRRASLALLVLASLFAAGCSAPADLAVVPADGPPVPEPARLVDAEHVEVRVPVPVILLGFEPGTAQALAQRLDPERVATTVLSLPRPVPPDPQTRLRESVPAPLVAMADYQVREAPPALAEAFLAQLAAWEIPDTPGVYDAVAAEAWLTDALREAGLLPEACCPGIVLLHAGKEGGHGWRARFENGWIEPIRYFGEAGPFAVLDVSARPDPHGHPMVVSEERPYTRPLPAGGDGTEYALELATRDAMRYRLLHVPIYPIATHPCHAVTLILAVRATALTEFLPDDPRAAESVYLDLLREHFNNLTAGAPVHLDLKILRLPQDDPALEVLTRGMVVNTVPVWQWIDANWEKYWVPHEGCEPYVSVMVASDAVEPGSSGVGLYAGNWTHRISLSVVGETSRIGWNRTFPVDFPGESDARVYYERPGWYTLFWTHEAGHTFGMAHTQDYSDDQGRSGNQLAFSTGLSPMGYELSGQTSNFGHTDRTTFARHRAGWAIHEARGLGLEGTPEFEEALARLGARDWVGAWQVLLPKLHPGA